MKTHSSIASILLLAILALTACSKQDEPTIGFYPALQRGDIDQIERHIYWGADLNQATPDGRMPLHIAAKAGRWIVVELLLDNGAQIDSKDQQGHSPLYEAVMAGRTQIAQLLIKRGATLDADQLLQAAIVNQVADRDVIELLVKKGADVNHPDSNGDSPLHLAVKKDYRVLTKLLIAHGANVNPKDSSGHTPLWYAIGHHNQEISTILKKNGATVE
jgi:ankyrin repeat protein